ncbi:insulin-like growth factor-binding protein 2-A [Tachysurus ichikawai]
MNDISAIQPTLRHAPGESRSLLTSGGWTPSPTCEMLVGSLVEQTEVPAIKRPTKDNQWIGPKESAVIHHRQQMKTKMKYKAEEPKASRTKLVNCLKLI